MRPPPPAVLLVLAYGAGLLTGLSHFRDPACVVLLLLGVALRRHAAAWLVGAVALGTLAGGAADAGARASCAARLPERRLVMVIRLAEPVDAEGGMARARPVASACEGDVTARFRRGRAWPAGTELRVTASWAPEPRAWRPPAGRLLVESADSVRWAPTVGDRLRNAVAGASARLYGARAPLVDALVTGRRSAMDRDLKDAFAASGLVHLLSISGFHVGLLAGWLVLLARAAGLRREPALVAGAALATAYVGFLGWPAPAVRAASLLWVLALMRVRQRAADPDALLAVTALAVLLADPWAVTDLGAWLSVLSLWGAVRCTRWVEGTGRRGWAWQAGASSVGATAATAPLTAAALGTVAPVGVVLNFAAIPLAAVAVPGAIVSLLLLPAAPSLAGALAAGAGLGLHGLEVLARAGAALPWGHVTTPEGLASAAPWALALAALLWATPRRQGFPVAGERLAWATAAGLWGALLLPLLGPSVGRGPGLTLHFLDVGQGDAAVVVTPGGHAVVIDAGPRDERFDAGRRVVVPFLERAGVRRVEALVLSHGHADHAGGAPAVLARVPVTAAIEPAAPASEDAYLDFLDALGRSEAAWVAGRPGLAFTLDSVRFRVLHPDPRWPGWGLDVNDDSVVLLVEYGAFRALFAGDAGEEAERALRGRVGAVHVLKVGHHGSRTSTSEAWLRELAPRLAVVSVGSNRYGHPAPEVLARLARHDAAVWRTDEQGTISVRTDGRRVTVSGRRASLSFDVTDGEAAPRPDPE